MSNDLRACSTAFFVMAERNPKLKKHRDGLENIINRAMEFVEESANTRRASEQSLHHASPRDDSLGPQVQQFVADNPCGATAELFDIHAQGLFPVLQDFPAQLNDGLTAGSPSVLHPFQGIFADDFDFWAGDSFNLPMLEGFNWRM